MLHEYYSQHHYKNWREALKILKCYHCRTGTIAGKRKVDVETYVGWRSSIRHYNFENCTTQASAQNNAFLDRPRLNRNSSKIV